MSNVPNKNFLSQLEFKFVVNRLPHISWFVQRINIPGISSPPPEVNTPFKVIPVTGDTLIYEPLILSFRVDEDMKNYFEVVDWMTGYGFPDSHDQYAALRNRGVRARGEGMYTDASLTILNSNMNTNVEIVYHDMFPTSIGEITFDTTDSDVEFITCDVQFHYLRWTRRKNS